ncbi:type I restriction endonuclease subunit R [Streptacidiphilus sp. PB12-B1b]|uniref:type I restriction endonuclease subunit R n=1 Tax=Streptacidiphilus sp. PB12-B1b TaxID=2705012 RepID=UPI0015F7ECD1|nr:type I restriction endonuclease [Streptacidiphilus sp. PB12-B1b]QMU79073.1 type I restriction endonuclease subunit R [Streptacidiphilus sp. PB12-B1b]
MNDARVYTEKAFENAVEAALLRSGWQRGLSNTYDHALGIDTSELAAFLGASQNDAWLALQAAYGEEEQQAIGRFAKRVAREIDSRGLLDVLRQGVNDRNVKIQLAYFRPAHTLAADALAEYDANRLTFVRQFHYSASRPADSLDVAFFLNGLPVASVELKNNTTRQTVEDAKRQYRRDRDPKELFFSKRSLVHFAVDPTLAFLTTRLAGDTTRFLPFNTGSGGPGQIGGAGNVPATTDGSYPTSYLFDEVWARDNWLDLLQRFLHVEDAAAKAGRAPSHKPGSAHTQPLIFPRFHQWDAVRKLTAHAARHGAGENYLIQHSAGSGKSNTIAWLAHRLSSLHTPQDPALLAPAALASGLGVNQLVFDKVIVITDRRLLDKQLQDTIYQFDHKAGVVVRIDESSQQLADALAGPTARIVITTVQKFPFVLDKVAGLGGQRYAVIIDEAHSSQGGESAAALKRALGRLGSDAVDEDSDPLTAAALARGRQPNLSFFAFTATPKAKTIDLFGTPLANPASGEQEKGPFHVYSMRQAVEEGFILDVLGNYVTYATYFKLQEAAADEAEQQVDPRKARSKLVRAALLSEASMASRAKIIVDHFRSHSSPRLRGQAKAMVVTSSREHAVRLYQAMRAYIDQRGFTDCGTLVAFSGALTHDGIEYTEPKLNGFPERELPARFGYTRADDPNPPSVPKPEYRILVVAEKYQTGFDQPLLTTMYVDKILVKLAAVQTLSRLNRTHPLKATEDLFILDFANRPEDIEQAFQQYYEASITEPTDPNLLFDREREVMAYQLLVEAEMDAFVTAYFTAFQNGATDTAVLKAHARLYGYLQPALDRFNGLNATEPDTAAEFRRALESYTKAYGWLSHVIGFENTELERLYQYGRFLLRRLPAPLRSAGADIGAVVPSHMRITQTGAPELHLEAAGAQLLPGLVPEAGAGAAEAEEMSLAEVIQSVNEEYGTGLSTTDQILLGQLVVAVSEDPELRAIALHQDQDVFGGELEKDLDRIVIDQAASNDALMVRYFDDAAVNRLFKQVATQQAYQLIRRPVRREAERRATEQRAAELKSSGTRRAEPPTP